MIVKLGGRNPPDDLVPVEYPRGLGGGSGEMKTGRLSTPRFRGFCGCPLLLHLAAPRSGRRRRRRRGARRGGRAAAEIRGIVLVVEERRAVIGLMLDPGVRVVERGLLALEPPDVEALPLRILPELLQDPLRRPRRDIRRRGGLARLHAHHVDEEEAAVERRDERQEDEERPDRVGTL